MNRTFLHRNKSQRRLVLYTSRSGHAPSVGSLRSAPFPNAVMSASICSPNRTDASFCSSILITDSVANIHITSRPAYPTSSSTVSAEACEKRFPFTRLRARQLDRAKCGAVAMATRNGDGRGDGAFLGLVAWGPTCGGVGKGSYLALRSQM
jgi:hypothetical protein